MQRKSKDRVTERKHRHIKKSDYTKAISRAQNQLKEASDLTNNRLENKLRDIANRLRAQMHVAGLMRRGLNLTDIKNAIGIEDEGTIGRYLDGKIAPEPPKAEKLENLYLEKRKKKAKPLTE